MLIHISTNNFNSDTELNLVRMLEIKDILFELPNYLNKIRLCKLAGIDVLNLYKVIKFDILNNSE